MYGVLCGDVRWTAVEYSGTDITSVSDEVLSAAGTIQIVK